MSKVALKGDALGTGTVTLSAPNTNDVIAFELPVTGSHLASAQADGMPLGPGGDPVVESGSNTDGQWVRWADGTQVCRAKGSTRTTSSGAGSIYIASTAQTFTYAQPFTQTPNVLDASEDVGTGSYGLPSAPRNVSATAATVRPYSHAVNAELTLGIFAVGRWK